MLPAELLILIAVLFIPIALYNAYHLRNHPHESDTPFSHAAPALPDDTEAPSLTRWQLAIATALFAALLLTFAGIALLALGG